MKLITAVIQPFKLDDVVLALEAVPGFPGMTVSDARGFGREHVEGVHDRREELTDFASCVRVEIAAEDHQVTQVVTQLLAAAHTGRRGDGRVWVHALEEMHSVRTMNGGGRASPCAEP